MRIEHTGYNVEDPRAVSAWYVEHLGFIVERAGGPPNHAHFLSDETRAVMVEIYNNPACPVPDYASQDPLILHLAFISNDVEADSKRLMAAGATVADPMKTTAAGDVLCMLRDPWGFPIQLVYRAESMVR